MSRPLSASAVGRFRFARPRHGGRLRPALRLLQSDVIWRVAVGPSEEVIGRADELAAVEGMLERAATELRCACPRGRSRHRKDRAVAGGPNGCAAPGISHPVLPAHAIGGTAPARRLRRSLLAGSDGGARATSGPPAASRGGRAPADRPRRYRCRPARPLRRHPGSDPRTCPRRARPPCARRRPVGRRELRRCPLLRTPQAAGRSGGRAAHAASGRRDSSVRPRVGISGSCARAQHGRAAVARRPPPGVRSPARTVLSTSRPAQDRERLGRQPFLRARGRSCADAQEHGRDRGRAPTRPGPPRNADGRAAPNVARSRSACAAARGDGSRSDV